jgi:hypothetical protein
MKTWTGIVKVRAAECGHCIEATSRHRFMQGNLDHRPHPPLPAFLGN